MQILIGLALVGRALAQLGSWQMLAGYQTASDVGRQAKIDLDMEELETFVGQFATSTTWRTDALFVYENGGNSVKASGTIRTLKGFATKDYASKTGDYAEQMPPIYTAYWEDNGYSAEEAAR